MASSAASRLPERHAGVRDGVAQVLLSLRRVLGHERPGGRHQGPDAQAGEEPQSPNIVVLVVSAVSTIPRENQA